MSTWYRKVQEDLGELVNCISAYEAILDEARVECGMKGNLEKLSRECQVLLSIDLINYKK